MRFQRVFNGKFPQPPSFTAGWRWGSEALAETVANPSAQAGLMISAGAFWILTGALTGLPWIGKLIGFALLLTWPIFWAALLIAAKNDTARPMAAIEALGGTRKLDLTLLGLCYILSLLAMAALVSAVLAFGTLSLGGFSASLYKVSTGSAGVGAVIGGILIVSLMILATVLAAQMLMIVFALAVPLTQFHAQPALGAARHALLGALKGWKSLTAWALLWSLVSLVPLVIYALLGPTLGALVGGVICAGVSPAFCRSSLWAYRDLMLDSQPAPESESAQVA